MNTMEPLLIDDEDRYSYLPIVLGREDIIKEYKRQQLSFWVATQIDMKEDKKHWKEGLIYPNTKNSNEKKINEVYERWSGDSIKLNRGELLFINNKSLEKE